MITRDTFEREIAPIHEELLQTATKMYHGNVPSAEDALQEALLKAFLHLDQFNGENFKGWLFKILRNTISNTKRTRRHGWGWKAGSEYVEIGIENNLPITSREPSPYHNSVFKELRVQIDKFIDNLSDIDREILQDAVDDVPQLDTAGRLKISRQAVATRLYKVREELRKYIHEA